MTFAFTVCCVMDLTDVGSRCLAVPESSLVVLNVPLAVVDYVHCVVACHLSHERPDVVFVVRAW